MSYFCDLFHKSKILKNAVSERWFMDSRVFSLYGHCGQLGHVTWIFIGSTLLYMLLIKFGFDWPKPLQRRRCLNIMINYMYIAQGCGQMSPWGPYFSESSIFGLTAHFLKDILFK